MTQYEFRPKAYWDSDYLPDHRTITVHDGREAVDTGLLDAQERTIYRLPEPIGFDLRPVEPKRRNKR